MDGIRLKLTPTTEADGAVRLLLEWVDVRGGLVTGPPLFTEEFAVGPHRRGCAYVSRVVFRDGEALPGTFWIDEAGLRHFVVQAEAGAIGLTGKPL